MTKPCARCPWRPENQSKRTPWHFYTKANLRRLWGGIRNGNPQSCHPTDPSHPDHIAAGTKPDAVMQECAGAIILVLREVARMQPAAGGMITDVECRHYMATVKDGLTKHGILYWMVQRIAFADKPFIGAPALPDVDTTCDVRRPTRMETR